MSHSEETNTEDLAGKPTPGVRTKLHLPTGEDINLYVDELISADVVEGNDSRKYIVLIVKGRQPLIVAFSEANVTALSKITTVNMKWNSLDDVLESTNIDSQFVGVDGDGDLAEMDSTFIFADIFFRKNTKVVAIIWTLKPENNVKYYKYDAVAKEALKSNKISLFLRVGGSTKVDDLTPT